MSYEKVLIVEDEPVVRTVLHEIFVRRKCTVSMATQLSEAEALVAKENFDLMMLDIRLPDGDGQKFLEHVAMLPDRPLVVMVTGNGSVESAVACMKAGAFDYVLKPFTPSQIDVILKKVQSYRQLLQVNRLLSDSADGDDANLLGRSPAMVRLRQLIDRVAPTDATVFIAGESGTGKEMIARELYRKSPRRQQPFIKVNCAAISENLIESEFFGHERGAFTGATQRREGRFELANNGTLLLDEVSEIPGNLQAKLLRVLQEREFERVGGSRTIKVNVRLLATSNRDLMRHVEQGNFRLDLYYRLNVFPVIVPPLRDRAEDILLLATHFLERYVRKHGVRPIGFSDSARSAMLSYRWPGNVRELQNTVERAVILAENGRPISAAGLGLGSEAGPERTGIPFEHPRTFESVLSEVAEEADATDLHVVEGGGSVDGAAAVDEAVEAPAVEAESPVSAGRTDEARSSGSAAAVAQGAGVLRISELEKQAIFAALSQTAGNRTQAAVLLGISIRTLRNKLQEYREAGSAVPFGDAD